MSVRLYDVTVRVVSPADGYDYFIAQAEGPINSQGMTTDALTEFNNSRSRNGAIAHALEELAALYRKAAKRDGK